MLFAFVGAISTAGQAIHSLHAEKEIDLPGVEGRIDHFSVDLPGQRLFVAALGNGSVEILDTAQGKRTGQIEGLQEPQGVCYDAKSGRLFVATAGDGKVRIYDAKSLVIQNILEFGDDADNVRVDPGSGDIWVGYGNGGIGIIDPTGRKVGSILLGSHPESFQFDEVTDRVYVNAPKQFGVAVVDRKKRAVLGKWGLGTSFANFPMAVDKADGRLFIGCRLPSRLVVLDTGSGRIIATLPIIGDTDDIFDDARRRLVYVLGGEGAVDVLRQRDPDNYQRVARVVTTPGARTGLFVPTSSRLYVAAPRRGSQEAKVMVYAIEEN
jgi:DNA-binding beta-propeller fold protein YncE